MTANERPLSPHLQVYRSGWLVVIATLVLTVAIWLAGYAVAGHWFAGAPA